MMEFNDHGLTADRLREVLHYDPLTGLWTAKIACSRRLVGHATGEIKSSGYVFISVDGGRHRAHRLAWLYMTGEWPADQVDHKDNIRSHNWWSNLRLADNQGNQANSRLSKNNKSGFKGVFWNYRLNRWQAKICPNRKQVHLGYFDSKEEAHAAYVVGARKYFGEFARAA